VFTAAGGSDGLDLGRLMRELAARGWSRVLIEGGAHLGGAALEAGIVDRVAFFIAPKILGGGLPAIAGMAARTMRSAIALDQCSARAVGSDWLIEAAVGDRRKRKG